MTKSTKHDAGEASATAEADEHTLGGLAGEVVDAFEHLGDSKSARKAAKSAKKDEKKEAKVAKKAAKQAEKDCKKACKAGVSAAAAPAAAGAETEHDESRITPKKARNAVSVAKVVVPAAVPVIAPIAVRAAGSAREAFDRYRARKLGVDVERLAEYSGYGAALHDRIAGASDGLAALRDAGPTTSGELGAETNAAFGERAQATLRQLSATVRAAERMPSVRRKSAHRAVAGELDQLESELLKRLGT